MFIAEVMPGLVGLLEFHQVPGGQRSINRPHPLIIYSPLVRDDPSHMDHRRIASGPAVSPLVVVVTTDPAHQGMQLLCGEEVPLIIVGIECHIVLL